MKSYTEDSWLVHEPKFLTIFPMKSPFLVVKSSFSDDFPMISHGFDPFSGQVEEVKKFLEDPDAYAAANPVAAAPAASGGGEAKKEEKKARNTWVDLEKMEFLWRVNIKIHKTHGDFMGYIGE